MVNGCFHTEDLVAVLALPVEKPFRPQLFFLLLILHQGPESVLRWNTCCTEVKAQPKTESTITLGRAAMTRRS
jgi:hypothetical protein